MTTKTKPKIVPRLPQGHRAPVDDAAATALLARLEARESAPAPSLVPVTSRAVAVPSSATGNDPRDVVRKGRLRADGTRSGARVLRRSTVYLPPELAQRLDVEAAKVGRDRSEIIADALAAWLGGAE